MADRVKFGTHLQLEDEATALIMASLVGVTNREDKADVLTPWKLKHRHTHEILTRTGAPVDPAVRKGIFGRAYNSVQTHLNSYDGPTRPMKMSSSWDPEDGAAQGFLSPQMSAVAGVERMDD